MADVERMTPAPGYVILRKKDAEKTTAGIVLPSEDASTAVVVKVANYYIVNGHKHENWLSEGDEVVLAPGTETGEHAVLPNGYVLAQVAHVVLRVRQAP